MSGRELKGAGTWITIIIIWTRRERACVCISFIAYSAKTTKRSYRVHYCIDDETQRTACNEFGHGVLYRMYACHCMCFVEMNCMLLEDRDGNMEKFVRLLVDLRM